MKNVYFIQNPKFPSITDLKTRLEQFDMQIVNSSSSKIDLLIVENINYDEQIKNRIKKIEVKFSPKILDSVDFLDKIGFHPDKRFILWQQYPNFDPWTGEKTKIWDDNIKKFEL